MSMIANYHVIDKKTLKTVLKMESVYEYFFELQNIKSDNYISIDQYWHALEQIFKADKNTEGLADLFLGGLVFGEDFGYGQPRYFRQSEIKVYASVLGKINTKWFEKVFSDELYQKFNDNEIFPYNWDLNDYSLNKNIIFKHLKQIIKFFKKANSRGDTIVAYYD